MFESLWWSNSTYSRTYLLTYILTYLLTPWRRVLLEKLTSSQPIKKFTTFYGTRRFITAFTHARYLSLSLARSIQSIVSHPTSWRSILVLSSHLRLGLPSGHFPSGLPAKSLHTSLLSPIRATCRASLYSIWSLEQYCVSSTDHWAPHHMFFLSFYLVPLRPKYFPLRMLWKKKMFCLFF